MLEKRVNLSKLVNPFYLYVIAFSLAIFVYSWGWCKTYPVLTPALLVFFLVSFILFIFAGSNFVLTDHISFKIKSKFDLLHDIVFLLIIILGIINCLLVGYIPILERSTDYRDFGYPVIDPVFNTLSIFFSVFFFQSFLGNKKKRLLSYVFIILIIQILLFRRSTIMWIITSSTFVYILHDRRIKLYHIILCFLSLPLLSYCFGYYGNHRSNLSKTFVLNSLGASDTFLNLKISHNHFMTYLYVSSPLSNLQKNLSESDGIIEKRDFKSFFFYCLLPQSLTLRLEKKLGLSPPECLLVNYNLIAGSFLMVSSFTLGWTGMIVELIYLFIFIQMSALVIKKFSTFGTTTIAILSTTVCLLIFSNFLIRADVLIMLFIYPVLFHFIHTLIDRNSDLADQKK